MREVLRTALCDLLGIDYPVLQSGMGSVAGPTWSPRCRAPAAWGSWPA